MRPRPAFTLCYHAVTDRWADALAVAPDVLETQLETLLRRGFRPVGPSEALDGVTHGFHVTFDDAYRNVADVAPMLEELGIRATVFVCSAYADDGRPLLIPELRSRAEGFEAELETLDWNGLRALAERGVEIGSHTVTHAHLTRLGDADLRRELHDSRAQIADELRRPCRFIAYPFGEHDARVREAAAAAGYEAAFALRPYAAERFAVPRIDVYRRDDAVRFAIKTSRAFPTLLRFAARGRAQE